MQSTFKDLKKYYDSDSRVIQEASLRISLKLCYHVLWSDDGEFCLVKEGDLIVFIKDKEGNIILRSSQITRIRK